MQRPAPSLVMTGTPAHIGRPLQCALQLAIQPGITRRSLIGSALALGGCGGGGGGGLGGGAQGSNAGAVAVGQITGFGSIILNANGVRIDDSLARISDDDGNDLRGKLKLGMCVAVVSATSTSGAVVAETITAGGELQGRVEGSPNTTLKTFVVLGQTVKVDANTVFDSSLANGFASLATDSIVEVHGLLNAQTNTLTASFIERKSAPSNFKIQGLVASHNASAKTFRIGPILISYSGITPGTQGQVLPADGALLRVRLTAVLPPALLPAQWQATRLRKPESFGDDRNEFEIEGSITAFTSAAAFSVNGVPVDASAAVFEQGAPAALALGARVEVKGRLIGGTLIAARVKVEDSATQERELELHGTLGNLTASTFELRGVTVEYGTGVTYRKGTVANLVNGARLEVKGVATSAVGGATRVRATRIEFESS